MAYVRDSAVLISSKGYQLSAIGSFLWMRDEPTAGGLCRRQSYSVLPEVTAGSHEQQHGN